MKHAAICIALVSMTVACSCAFAAASGTFSNSVVLQKTNNPTPAAASLPRSSFRPDQLPVSRISSLTRDMAARRTNGFVRVEGVVLDQRLGEYVIIQGDSASIRAETRQTTLLAGGERVTIWGIPAWDGNNVYLRLAGVRPLSWDALAIQRVVPAPDRPEELPTLTQVRQIRDLTPERAAWKYPVRVRGVITTIWKDYRSLFVQDGTAGIFVDGAGLGFGTNWDTGDEVELEGVSGPGGYAPIIEAHSARKIGPAQLPAARMVTLYQMASGQLDGQWVEVRGVVRSVRVNKRSTDLQLSDVNGLVEVNIPGGDVFTNFLDSLVRVRGVCGSRANPNRQLMGAYVWSPRTNLLVVEELGISDPFAAPVHSIGSLSQFSHWRETQHLIKIVGVVTFSQPDRPLFVQDETGGMPVYLAHPESLQPGDRVEVSGYLSPGDFGYAFRNAYCRVVAHDRVPQPKSISAIHVLDPNLHGMWVELSARLLSSSRRANEQVLTLRADNSIFEALLPVQSGPAGGIPPLGSLVQLKGVYSVLSDESRQPRAMRLYIPGSAPIQLLEKAPWWNSRRASAAVGSMVIVVLAAALWAITLRRRVAQQTLDIRQRLVKEAALEESYRELFEGANDLIYTFDLDGRMTSLNPAGQRVLGYSGSEIEQLTIDRVLSPSSRSRIDQMLQSKSAYGSTTFECELIAKNGRSLLVETSARLMLKDGQVNSLQAISRDIAERKRVEETLRESEAHYRQLVEMSPNSIFIESEGKVAFINKAGLSLFGASSPDELLGRPVLDFIHPNHRAIVLERMTMIRDKHEPVPLLEEKYVRLDGRVVDVEAAAAPILFEGKPAAQVIIHDITERKRAEKELFESRQMLRTVLDTIPQRVFWKDRNSVFIGCNKSLAADSGYSDPSEMIGKTDFDTKASPMSEAYRADDKQVMESGVPRCNYEEPLIKTDGTRAWLKTSKVPLFDAQGQIIGLLGTYEDITERKAAEGALAEASALLQTLLDHSPDFIYFKDSQSRFVAFSKAFERLFNVADAGTLRGKTDFDFFTEEHARVAYDDEQEIIRSGKPIIGKLEQETHQDGRITWALTTKMPWMAQDGSIIGTFGISKDVTAIQEAEAELAYERELFRVLLDNFPDSIYFKDLQSRFVRVSRSKAEMTLDLLRAKALAEQSGDGPKELPPHLANVEAFTKHLTGKTDFETYQREFASTAFEEEQKIIQTRQPIIGKLEYSESGKWFLVTKMPWINKDGQVIGTFGVSRDITALKETETKLEAAHRRLIETSRLAGMAEVATDVLHNVGNVLNSVNVSCSLTLDRIRSSKISSLSKVSALLMENRERFAEFVSQDPRGRQIPEFLTALADHLGTEQIALVDELQQLVKHIDHIKQIVAMQQTYAKVVGVLEPVNPLQLVEDALQINAAALLRHEVKLQRHFHEETLQILTDKHKVLQILVNLIRNAKYAMDDGPAVEKLLTVKVDNDEKDQVVIQVIDNGVGIPKENLTRIFSHGFTTRRNGHGFGLHSSALAVRELGGSIQATSDGLGAGATFTLILPKEPPHQSPETA